MIGMAPSVAAAAEGAGKVKPERISADLPKRNPASGPARALRRSLALAREPALRERLALAIASHRTEAAMTDHGLGRLDRNQAIWFKIELLANPSTIFTTSVQIETGPANAPRPSWKNGV